jgi:ATP-dependent helicase HrpA
VTVVAGQSDVAAPDDAVGRLRGLIEESMLRDRHRLRRRLDGILRSGRTPSLDNLVAAAQASAAIAASRRASVPELSYPEELPVSGRRDEIAEAIRRHRAVVVCGETGSGKTTQLPKICLEAGRGVYGVIGHTQPRRIAARTVAARVAQEIGSSELVGYKVRFHDQTSPASLVKLMTDGILLAETQGDRFLNQYDTIIVDEAHERSLNIDFLLGHLKNLLDKRPELKVVVTSATIDPDRFSHHFGGPEQCPVINVTGRTYPVEVRYRPLFEADRSRDREGALPGDSAGGSGRGSLESLPDGRGSGVGVESADAHRPVVASHRSRDREGALPGDFVRESPRGSLESLPDGRGSGVGVESAEGHRPPVATHLSRHREVALPGNFVRESPRRSLESLPDGRGSGVGSRGRGMGSDPQDINDAIINAVDELGRDPVVANGDTLIFFSGEREIRDAAKALSDHVGGRHGHYGSYDVLPLYARLSSAEQDRVFKPGKRRRIVLATNVAETSLTVPGIRSVIDTGLARISRYSTRSKVQRLPIEPVSRASANQRAGRCGRVAPGVCVRLYDEADYDARPEFTDPEIQRTNLAAVILQMAAFGLGAVESFPFIDPPDLRQVRDGYQTLQEIGAIDEHKRLTEIGRVLARLPIDPKLGRMVMAAEQEDCLEEMIIIAAGLSIQDPRERPVEKQKQADEAHAIWKAGGSDFLTLVNLWRWYHTARRERSRNKLRQLCREHYVNYLRMMEWGDLQRQLRESVAGLASTATTRQQHAPSSPSSRRWQLNRQPASGEQVHRAVLPGLLGNVGRKGDANEYAGVRGRKFFLFPGSVTFGSKPQWVVAAELVETSRLYARFVCSVKPEWVEEAAGELVKRTYGEPYWQMKTGRVIAPMKVTLWGLPVAKRPIDYAKVDPRKSRSIFIRSGLVDGDLDSGAAFFRHNRQLVRDVELLEAKTRRRDLLVEPETQFAFYDARLPASVVDQRSFEQWRGDAERGDRRLLFMRQEDLLARLPNDDGGGQFPDTLETNGIELSLSYRFDPGHPGDGVTATVALADLHAIDADRLDWLVPGLIEEKVIDLIRTLPKPVRTGFVPVPEHAHRAVLALPFGEGNLLDRLARFLGKQRGLDVRASYFRPENLTDFLRLNLRVVDEHGKTVAHGRDVRELRSRLKVQARSKLAEVPDPTWNRENLVEWGDLGDLPMRVEVTVNRRGVQAFPALVDRGESVSLKLFETAEAARAAHRRGVRRLLLLDYAGELRHQVSDLPDLRTIELLYKPLGNARRLRDHLAEAAGDALFLGTDPADIRTAAAFEERVNAAWGKLGETVRRVGKTAHAILHRRHAVELRLQTPVTDLLQSSVNDMLDQLAHLVPGDFLLATPAVWLGHVPRYLAAIEQRHAKLLDAGLDRDSKLATAVFPYWKAYLDRVADPDAGPLSQRWIDFRWMIEEYRVSRFAQPLGTAIKISDKVLREQMERLE